jgi:hypothetical protein
MTQTNPVTVHGYLSALADPAGEPTPS